LAVVVLLEGALVAGATALGFGLALGPGFGLDAPALPVTLATLLSSVSV
jgi:hypothetical protein